MDLHNYKRNFERTLQRIEESKEISQANKKLIFTFKDHLLSDGIGIAKINRYVGDLTKFNRLLGKTFGDATEFGELFEKWNGEEFA